MPSVCLSLSPSPSLSLCLSLRLSLDLSVSLSLSRSLSLSVRLSVCPSIRLSRLSLSFSLALALALPFAARDSCVAFLCPCFSSSSTRLNLRVGFDGDIYLTIILNGYIHTIMYTYYFVSQHTKVRSQRKAAYVRQVNKWVSR